MTEGVSRISISVPPDLLRKFDEALKRLGYEERSKAIQTAMQSFVTESKWLCAKKGRGIGAIVMVYDSTIRQVGDVLTEIQHKYRGIAETTIHMRLRGLPRQFAFQHLFHQHDATARRIHLLPELLIGRAHGETEPAMHARLNRARHRPGERAVLV